MTTSNSSDPLSPAALVDLAKQLSPSPDTQLVSPTVALALLIHAIHSALSFRLVSPAPAPPSDGEQSLPNALPDTWPPHPGGQLKFDYKHEQSTMNFQVTVVELGARILVAAVAVEVSQQCRQSTRTAGRAVLHDCEAVQGSTGLSSAVPHGCSNCSVGSWMRSTISGVEGAVFDALD